MFTPFYKHVSWLTDVRLVITRRVILGSEFRRTSHQEWLCWRRTVRAVHRGSWSTWATLVRSAHAQVEYLSVEVVTPRTLCLYLDFDHSHTAFMFSMSVVTASDDTIWPSWMNWNHQNRWNIFCVLFSRSRNMWPITMTSYIYTRHDYWGP
jgi:hypothetical protein